MRILGIDPGTVRTGWGIVDVSGSRITGVEAGVVCPKRDDALHDRLRAIYEGLSEVVARYHPTVAAVEDLFHAKHAAAALKLGHARGVALLAAANANLDVFAYPPAVVKRTVAGRGRAEKVQVARFVGLMLGWKEQHAMDATDALAVAITHAQRHRVARSGLNGRS